jgi:general secretion pathway protein G
VSQSNSHARTAGRRGLTIIELMIGAAIAAVLVAVAVPQFVGYVRRTEGKQAVADIRMFEMLIERYRTEMGALPNDLGASVDPLPSDPWGNSYQYLNLQSGKPNTKGKGRKNKNLAKGKARKNKNLVPINSDYDLYSKGLDGESKVPLTTKVSHDDVIRANDGAFVGLAEDY